MLMESILLNVNLLDSIYPDLNVEPSTGSYYPTIFFNEFWLLRNKLIPINETVDEVPLNLEVGPISMTKWQLFLQIDQSFQVHRSYGSMLEGESDELKVLLLSCVLFTLYDLPCFLGFAILISSLNSRGYSWKEILISWGSQWLFRYFIQCLTSSRSRMVQI